MDDNDRRKIHKFMRDGAVALAAATVLMAKHHNELVGDEAASYDRMRTKVEEIFDELEIWERTN